MRIKLNLKKHCIETETKRLYNRCVSQYFKPHADREHLEKKIELLLCALELFDFAHLRSAYPELAGHNDDDIALIFNEQNKAVIIINGKNIDPLPLNG